MSAKWHCDECDTTAPTDERPPEWLQTVDGTGTRVDFCSRNCLASWALADDT